MRWTVPVPIRSFAAAVIEARRCFALILPLSSLAPAASSTATITAFVAGSMRHMSSAWHSVQRTVRNVLVKARRLLINVDQSIFLAGNDDDRHFQVGVALV